MPAAWHPGVWSFLADSSVACIGASGCRIRAFSKSHTTPPSSLELQLASWTAGSPDWHHGPRQAISVFAQQEGSAEESDSGSQEMQGFRGRILSDLAWIKMFGYLYVSEQKVGIGGFLNMIPMKERNSGLSHLAKDLAAAE